MSDKAFNIAKDPKYDGYQYGLASKADKLFEKKPFAKVFRVKLCQTSFLQT